MRGGEREYGGVGRLVEGDRDGVVNVASRAGPRRDRARCMVGGEFRACQLRQQCEFGTRSPLESPVGQPGEGHGAQDCGVSADGDRGRAGIDADRNVGADDSAVDVVGSVLQLFVDGEVGEDRPETQAQTGGGEDHVSVRRLEAVEPGSSLGQGVVAVESALCTVAGEALLLDQVGDPAGERGRDAEEQEPPHSGGHGQHYADADGDEERPPLRWPGRPGIVDRLRHDMNVVVALQRWGSYRRGRTGS